MAYAYAQTFYVDPTATNKAAKVNITGVHLWFRAKPRIDGNKSGIYGPGVNVGLVPTLFGVPLFGQDRVDTNISWSRQEWGSIHVTADATLPTFFRFTHPITVSTGKEYAIVVQFDGDEDFLLWTNKQGDQLVGTNNISPGASGRFIGKLYTYISPSGLTSGTFGYSDSALGSNNTVIPSISSQSETQTSWSQEYLLSSWRPLDSTDLKFSVSIARYFHNGVPVQSNNDIINDKSKWIYGSYNSVTPIGNNMLRVSVQANPTEFITYDRTDSIDTPTSFGEAIYQDRPYWTGGKNTYCTCATTNGTSIIAGNTSFTLANGSTFKWSHIFSSDYAQDQYIVVTSLNHDGVGAHRVNVRRVIGVSNNRLGVTEPLTFTNSVARFFVAPVGRISSKLKAFGTLGKMSDMIVLSGSNANGTCRFVNNSITNLAISANGGGYNNSDYIEISGYEEISNELYGGYKAVANVQTNASGNLTAIYLTNAGCGFVNTAWLTGANIVIKAAGGGSSAGTGATLSITIGSTLKTEKSGGTTYFSNCKIINLDALQITPLLEINNPAGTTHSIRHRTLYYSATTTNTQAGKKYLVNDDASMTDFVVQNGKLHNYTSNQIPCIVSRSNQYAIRFANGFSANDDVVGRYASNTATYIVDVASNNDFVGITFGNTLFTSNFAKYIINNDYTNEHTNYGNAWAKHVTTKVNFADGRKAEDLLVYLTAFRPMGTDLKVYARIHNSLDDEAFDLKDWTLLEQTDGIDVYSNPQNQTDMKEFTYNFPAYPNTDITCTGTVTTTLSSATITGAGTLFNTQLAQNDLVRIYQPLFPNNYFVTAVASIGSDTSITLADPVSNNGLVGAGLKIDKIKYPKQAFNDILNSNVVTYFTNTGSQFTTFDSMQIKVIFLSNNDNIVPKIDDCRGVAVTA
jgi:hypothetical protein